MRTLLCAAAFQQDLLTSTRHVHQMTHVTITQESPAAIISDRVTCRLIATPRDFATFQSVCFSLTGSGLWTDRRLSTGLPTRLCHRHRRLVTELISYLEMLELYKCQIIVASDCNIHVEQCDDSAATLQSLPT